MHEKWLGEITENIGEAFIINTILVPKEYLKIGENCIS